MQHIFNKGSQSIPIWSQPSSPQAEFAQSLESIGRKVIKEGCKNEKGTYSKYQTNIQGLQDFGEISILKREFDTKAQVYDTL